MATRASCAGGGTADGDWRIHEVFYVAEREWEPTGLLTLVASGLLHVPHLPDLCLLVLHFLLKHLYFAPLSIVPAPLLF